MTRDIKPIKVYGGYFGPNPLKTCIILSELDLPYECEFIEFLDVKNPSYVRINPNGRMPAIHDPNTDLTLWESGAIVEYLIEQYDRDHRLSFPAGTAEAHHARQWLHFQASGQGPYYGQAVWFTRYHSERLPSAVERYVNEIKRVSGVVDKWLEGREWLVGDRLSYADLAWVAWQVLAQKALKSEGYDESEFPRLQAWLTRMKEREKVKEMLEKNEKLMQEKQRG
ncbi:hypothetical protein EYZ11_006719 [Aspergillus tanneri]|uniref:glutathione transferase n=1 Tax=Aspergillus tanneri TaxID=1220188 RepID=A0A4S3JKG4_9EURO|nr:uncharacterized protein ATNIH1004_004468 [Aspergillus tanneri]KAA8648583.1 hypothetical protein ATNIH1004_004468 [Aspergillus tanneri]THC93801.1 hypothetical protein EYZ11_006719 [Aspergillus tanneri]